jgi:hypothetical protein
MYAIVGVVVVLLSAKLAPRRRWQEWEAMFGDVLFTS